MSDNSAMRHGLTRACGKCGAETALHEFLNAAGRVSAHCPPCRYRRHIAVGDRFERGVVIETGIRLNGESKIRLRCDCGNIYTCRNTNLRNGTTRSCGCARQTHGLSGHALKATFYSMHYRCEKPGYDSYPNYGGRGIKVCPQWSDIATFIADIERLIGPRPDGMTLDRIDNDGDYEPGNIRWATREQQIGNSRRGGMTPAERREMDARAARLAQSGVSTPDIAEILGVTYKVAYDARRRGLASVSA